MRTGTARLMYQVPSALSLICDIFVIISFLSFQRIRQYQYLQFVFFVAFADIWTSSSLVVGFSHKNTFACEFQSRASVFGNLSTLFWEMMISYQLFLVLRDRTVIGNSAGFHLIGWVIPLVFTFCPDFTETPNKYYGFDDDFWNENEGFCFFKYGNDPNSLALHLSYLALAILYTLLNLYFLMKSFVFLSKLGDSPAATSIRSVVNSLKLYPPVVVILYAPILIILLLFQFDHPRMFGLASAYAVIFYGCVGMANTLILLSISPIVFNEWIRFFKYIYRTLLGIPPPPEEFISHSSHPPTNQLKQHILSSTIALEDISTRSFAL